MARVKMGLKSLDDDKGYNRGRGHYSASDCGMMSHKADYSGASGNYGQSGVSGIKHLDMDEAASGMKNAILAQPQTKTWQPGPVSKGGRFHSTNGPPKGDATLRSVRAAQPTGKFKKKGGKGQRSGA